VQRDVDFAVGNIEAGVDHTQVPSSAEPASWYPIPWPTNAVLQALSLRTRSEYTNRHANSLAPAQTLTAPHSRKKARPGFRLLQLTTLVQTSLD
jgi:hypothetical protein